MDGNGRGPTRRVTDRQRHVFTMRLPSDTYDALVRVSKDDGTTVTAQVNIAVSRYLRERGYLR